MKYMGSTGHSTYATSRKGNVNNETFGIPGASNFTGRVTPGKGIENAGANKVTLRLPSTGRQDIVFQFKLTKDNKLFVAGYDPNKPEAKAHIELSSSAPSLDKAAAVGSDSDKQNALKLKDMMAKSVKINESQLGAIANKLLSHKKSRENS